jgi:queuine tRNA-ribosyltransferase
VTEASFSFRLDATEGAARAGEFATPHGAVETPAFMPVGTHAAIRGLATAEVAAMGARMLLANAYHLYLRPGDAVVRALGGLHAFARWNGPMLTDSGGFQVLSLARYREVREDGITFRSKLDGSLHEYTPERVIQVQRNLGADVIMQLDELIDGGSEIAPARDAMERSLRWLERCRAEFDRITRDGRAPLNDVISPVGTPPLNVTSTGDEERLAPAQALFPIVQGGVHRELRLASLRGVMGIGEWQGVAVGGLSTGEPKPEMYAALDLLGAELPPERPRYLMGVGFPDDLVEGVRRGMDLFDCVAPTRMGRHGTAFTPRGTLQLLKGTHRLDRTPLVDGCPCPACTQYDRAYLRHLFAADEPLGPRLIALHNLAMLIGLMREARAAIMSGTFSRWSDDWLREYRAAGAIESERSTSA